MTELARERDTNGVAVIERCAEGTTNDIATQRTTKEKGRAERIRNRERIDVEKETGQQPKAR